MKIKFFSLVAATCLAGSILMSCGKSSDQKLDEAKENLEAAGEDLKDAQQDAAENVKDTLQADWAGFKGDMEIQITKNENDIKALKEKVAVLDTKAKTKAGEEIEKLSAKNIELKKKLDQYKEEGKDKEIAFKKEFKHDMDELGHALKDLFVKNVK